MDSRAEFLGKFECIQAHSNCVQMPVCRVVMETAHG